VFHRGIYHTITWFIGNYQNKKKVKDLQSKQSNNKKKLLSAALLLFIFINKNLNEKKIGYRRY